MHTLRYVVVLANGAVERRTALTLGEGTALLGDRDGYVWPVEVNLTPPPLKVATLAPDATLIVTAPPGVDDNVIAGIAEVLTAAVDDRWLILDGLDAVGPSSAAISSSQAADRLPWSHYAPELTARLKGLIERFPHRTVADAAVTLADLVDTHGPEAVARRRGEQ